MTPFSAAPSLVTRVLGEGEDQRVESARRDARVRRRARRRRRGRDV